ncbi:hypothetical protein LCGC14_0828640 [marine sediment metagenome]|uniref:Uncharacterized protein n=1 Tax=marine sediment metagenome TaxID=412755 RepID=A0A0F9PGL4_9ZZZZ
MLDINNEKDFDAIREVVKLGMKGDFWNLILQDLKEAKKYLQKKRNSDDLMELPADQYKMKSELIKAKIKYLNILINVPKNLISGLEKPDNKKPTFDPYY